MKKWIYSAVAMCLLVALLYIGLGFFSSAKSLLSNINNDQQDANRIAMEYDIVKYDGLKVSGSTAITYIKTVVTKHSIPVQVTTTKGTFTCKDSSLFAKFRDIDAEQFINPMVEYSVTVKRDANDVIEMVQITYVK